MRPDARAGARVDAEAIFRAGLSRVDPATMMGRCLSLEGEALIVDTGLERAAYELSSFDRIVVAGFGKASGLMASALEGLLGGRIAEGLVIVKGGQAESLARIRILEAGHPMPDARSVAAGREILALASRVRKAQEGGVRCLVVMLISGGGSALLCAPHEGLDLEDKARATELLLASGATIQEMNAVRKHLSAVKGGRLARAFAPATILSLVLSDVVGDDLDVIASGPAAPDGSTWEAALRVVERRGLASVFPPRALSLLENGAAGGVPETPKPGDPIFVGTRSFIVGCNDLALKAAEAEARELGYHCLSLGPMIRGEAREIAHVFSALAFALERSGLAPGRPACVLAGGETTVTLRGKGRGGRNQEMALSFLRDLASTPARGSSAVFLSAGTDGDDGPTDAAGAFADRLNLERALALGLDPQDYLERNDSHSFFEAAGGLFKTGQTGTNVGDIQVLLVP